MCVCVALALSQGMVVCRCRFTRYSVWGCVEDRENGVIENV